MALTKFNYNSFDVTPVASATLGFNSDADGLTTAPTGAMVLIKTLTSDGSDDDLSFVDGTDDVVLDNTYSAYKFVYLNIHPETDNAYLEMQANAVGGSGYNETHTSTNFNSYHEEAGTDTADFGYDAATDSAQVTTGKNIADSIGNDNDQGVSGEMWLFNPSSTTFVTQFLGRSSVTLAHDYQMEEYYAGYFNTTAAIDEIQFRFNSGELQGGSIKLYGIKDS